MYKYFWYLLSELNLQTIKKEYVNSLTLFLLDTPYKNTKSFFEPLYFDTDNLSAVKRIPGMLIKEFE